MTDTKSDMVPLAGLWKQTSKSGAVYYSGKIGFGAKLLLFPNTDATPENKKPNLRLYVVPYDERKKGEGDSPISDVGDIPF